MYNMAIGMGRIDIILPDDIEEKFRRQVGQTYGARRGALTDAITNAITNWIGEQAQKEVEQENRGKKK